MAQRRQNGTGSISRRKDGSWTGRITLGIGDNGKPKVRAVYGRTESEVRKKLKELQMDMLSGSPSTIVKQTVRDYMAGWLVNTKQNELKPRSFDRLEQTLELYIYPNIGYLQVTALNSDDVQGLINRLIQDEYSFSVIKKVYDAINACFKHGIAQRKIDFNPAVEVTLPRKDAVPTKSMQYYTTAEMQKICSAATAETKNGYRIYRFGDAIVFAANTGLRLAELCGLRWSDIDFEQRNLHVHNTLVMVKNRDEDQNVHAYKRLEQKSTKSASGQRVIHLNDEAYAALQHMYTITGGEKFVFTTKHHEAVHPRFFDRLLRKVVMRAGLGEEKQYGMHALRHTFASMLFAAGTDVKTVSVLLGHADTAITYNTYIHLIDDQATKAVAKIPSLTK